MGCRRKNNLFIYENQFEDGRIFCHKCSSCYCSCPKYRFSSARTPDNLKSCSDYNSNSLRDLSLDLRSSEKNTETAFPELNKHESYQKSVISPPRKYSSSSSTCEASSSTYSNDTSPMYCSTFSSRSTSTSLYSSPSKSSVSSNYQRLSPNCTTRQYLSLSPISPVKSTPSSRCCSPLDYSFSSPIYPLSPQYSHLESPEYSSSTNFDYSPLEYPQTPQNNNKPKSPFLDRSPTFLYSPFNPNYSDFSPLSPDAHTFSPITDHKKTYFNFDKPQHYSYSSLTPTHSPFTSSSTFKGRHLPRSAPCKYCTLSPRTYF